MEALLKRLQQRIMLMVARAVLLRVDDNTKMQALQLSLLAGEVRDNVERFQNYGFSAYPHPGAEAVVVCVGGNRDHGLVVAVDDRRYRLKGLAAGEVALYTDEGDKVVLKRGRVVEIETQTLRVNAGTRVELNTPLVTVSGEVQAVGDITDLAGLGGSTMGSMRSIYNSHKHHENNTSGPTDVPDVLM